MATKNQILQQFFLLLFAISQCNCTERFYSRTKRTKIQSFLLQLLQQDKFESCKLMFLGHQDDDGSSETLEYLASSSTFSYYNVIFKYTPEPGNISTVPLDRPVHFPPSIRNHFKRSGQCYIVIVVVKDRQPEFMTQIFNMITPVFIPKTRKDEDYFIFITKHEDSKAVLMMNELPARTKFKISVSESEAGELLIRSICFFCNDGSPELISFPNPGHVEYFPDFVTQLNGKTLRVSVPSYTSRIEIDHSNHGSNNAKRGLWKNLFEDFLGIKFNFTYRMFWSMGNGDSVRRGGTGLQLPNGTWTGIAGDLFYGNADLGILAAITLKRSRVMENSDTFFDLTYLTFVTSEGTQIFSPLAIFWPFDELMWLLIFLSAILSVVVFKLLIKSMNFLEIDFSSGVSLSRTDGTGGDSNWGLSNQIQLIITSLLDQSCSLASTGPVRCYVALFLFYALVITSAYKSKLVSLMAFPVTQEIPKTFADLAYSDFEVGFMKHGDSAYNTLTASTDPVYVKLVAEMNIITGVGLSCLEDVVKSKHACIAYAFALLYLKAQNLTDLDARKLVTAPDSTYNVWLGLNYEGRSIYKKNFDKWLRLTRPMHFADIWEKTDYNNVRKSKLNWWQETGQTDKFSKLKESDNTLVLKQLMGSFWLLIVGLIIGQCCFLTEICKVHGRYLNRRIIKSTLVGVNHAINLCWRCGRKMGDGF